MENNNLRIKDIARLAGVSVGTVDRVIHKRGNVSPASLEKIMAVLNKTGYKPNLLARTLGSNKKYFIATLTPDPKMDEYWEQSNDGIREARKEWAHYNIEVTPFYFDLYDKTSFKKVANEIAAFKPDAILSSPIFHVEGLEVFTCIQNEGIPYIFFNSNVPEVNPLCFIGQNLYQSGRLCAELLDISCNGSGTFAVLHVYEDIQNSVHLAAKEKGFTDYFKDKNNPKIKVEVHDYSTPDKKVLKKEVSVLLDNPEIKGVLISTSKGVSMTAKYLEKAGRGDIKVVGYDLLKKNIEYLEKGIVDFLIHQNPTRQAALGIGYLANYLLFQKEVPRHDFFPLDIITRENLHSFLDSTPQQYQLNPAYSLI